MCFTKRESCIYGLSHAKMQDDAINIASSNCHIEVSKYLFEASQS